MVMTLDPASAGPVFDVRADLRQDCAEAVPGRQALLPFLVRAFRGVHPDGLMLNFGSGPALWSLITAAIHVREIHVIDPDAADRAEVRRWLLGQPSARDGATLVAAVLRLEGGREGLPQRVLKRVGLVRKCVTRLLAGDTQRRPPIDPSRPYDVLAAHFCSASTPEGPEGWRGVFGNLVVLLRPGGRLVLSAWEGSASCPAGSNGTPREGVREADVRGVLTTAGFVPETIRMARLPADGPGWIDQGVLLAVADKENRR